MTETAAPTAPIEGVRKDQHTNSSKLEDQAATAALYVTRNQRSKNGQDFLDREQKLSSAGAAASLKYAKPQDLPSYPSVGLKGTSAAGTAASLGWANQKSFEHWKPDPSTPAATAALLAKDYKMKPIWQPEQSQHGAAAALLAHKNDGKVEIWKPEASLASGSAATQAFKKYGIGKSSSQVDHGYTDLGRHRSLMAATGAMSSSRKRAESTPQPPRIETYPDEANAVANALSAATSAHKSNRQSHGSSAGGSVPFTNMPREMYTSHPPVAPEVNELNRQNSLHASAVAMAQQMYKIQQKQIDQANNTHGQRAAAAAHGRRRSISSSGDDVQPMRFNNLQQAAQKLASERLAKLDNEYSKNREYRDYYNSSPQQPQSRLSIRGRTRRRASSDGGLDEDREQSNKIRAQMSIFSNNLNQVDKKKQAQDRENLIAIAQRNVAKSLHGMDEKLFADTGKVAPSLMNEWEAKAQSAAQAKSDARMENHGRVHIGGGKFVNQSAIDLVATRNIQPVLDDINEKAEIKRVRDAEIKVDQEKAKVDALKKKEKEKEEREIHKKLKQQDKEEEKIRKAEEKATRDEEKRIAKENQISQKVEAAAIPAPTSVEKESEAAPQQPRTATESAGHVDENPTTNTILERRQASPAPADIRTSMEEQASLRMRENAQAANPDEVTPMSPTSPKEPGKVKNWLKTKFRRSSRAQKSPDDTADKEFEKSNSGFIGGAALTGASAKSSSTTSLGANADSVHDVALASSANNKMKEDEPVESAEAGPSRRTRASSVSSVSSLSSANTGDEEEFQEARDDFDQELAPPPTFPAQKSSSPARAPRFKEEI